MAVIKADCPIMSEPEQIVWQSLELYVNLAKLAKSIQPIRAFG